MDAAHEDRMILESPFAVELARQFEAAADAVLAGAPPARPRPSRGRLLFFAAALAAVCVAVVVGSTLAFRSGSTGRNAFSPLNSTGSHAVPSHGTARRAPSWTPAARVTAPASGFLWGTPTELRGKLLRGAWTRTTPFTLPAGPATVVGILKVPGSTSPRFAASLVPEPRPESFAGYPLARADLVYHFPALLAGEGVIAGWFPYQLPAGSYRLLVRETTGGGSGGSYDLNVAGVK